MVSVLILPRVSRCPRLRAERLSSRWTVPQFTFPRRLQATTVDLSWAPALCRRHFCECRVSSARCHKEVELMPFAEESILTLTRAKAHVRDGGGKKGRSALLRPFRPLRPRCPQPSSGHHHLQLCLVPLFVKTESESEGTRHG